MQHSKEWLQGAIAVLDDLMERPLQMQARATTLSLWQRYCDELAALDPGPIEPGPRNGAAWGLVEQCEKALEECAPEDPMTQDDQGGCVWCGASGPHGTFDPPEPQNHDRGCGWLKARHALSAIDEARRGRG
jgi:hypothetical protein